MAYKCELCFKGIEVGRSHTHHPGVAGGRWKKRAQKTRRVFKPNLHIARIAINGIRRRMKLCTKCLRKVKSQSFDKAIRPELRPRAQDKNARVKSTIFASG